MTVRFSRLRAAVHPMLVAGALAVFAGGGLAIAAPDHVALGEPTSAATVAHVPARVPRDYVVTPNGFFHPSCVQRVDADETVRGDGSIVRSDGSTRRPAMCAYPHFAADGTELQPDSAPLPPGASNPPEIDGWVAYASYTVPLENAATLLAANMSVPTAPSVPAGQVVYFFPGLEDGHHVVTILQPVLGWNAFNDSGWTVASWNCCMNGQTWHSAPVHVESGDTLFGLITSSNCSGSLCTDWSVLTRDLDSNHDTTLNTSGFGQTFNWIFGAVLESYGITECGNLPESSTEEFSRIGVHTLTSPLSSTAQLPAWDLTIVPSDPDCTYTVTPHPKPNSQQITLGY